MGDKKSSTPPKSTSPNNNKKTQNKIVQTVVSFENSIADRKIEMSTSILASIEKLKGRENYSSWKFSMQNYLQLEGLSKCITGEETEEKKNAQAKAAISLSILPMNFVHIRSATTAKEVWTNLEKTFEDKGSARKVTLVRAIVNTKLKDCVSMDEYVSNIISTAQKLNEVGFAVPDEWLAIFLLAGLTEDYQPLVLSMESGEGKLSSDSVKTKLLQEPSSGAGGDTALLANRGNNRNRGNRKKGDIICYTCRLKGHKSSNCPSKSKDSGAKSVSKTDKAKTEKKPAAFSAVFLSGKYDKDDWYIDSGATRHMTMHSRWITGTRKYGEPAIRAANGELMEVECRGTVEVTVEIDGETSMVQVHDVLCIPKLTTNLLSVSKICDKQNTVFFSSEGCVIENLHGDLLATGSLTNGLYRLDTPRGMALATMSSIDINSDMYLWHRRLGHVNPIDLNKMRNGGVTGVSFSEKSSSIACVACCKGKQSRKPFRRSDSRAKQLLELVHADLAGKMETRSIGGSHFFFVLVDDYSRRTFVYMLKHKNEAFDRFCSFKRLVENQTGFRVKIYRSDNGTEFCNNKFTSYFDKHGIQHQRTMRYTPQQNGMAERTIRTLVEKASCMLHDADLPK